MENFKMVAKCLFGFEEILARELRTLGAGNVGLGTRNVSFAGDTGFMYKANLCCRTAIKVLKPIASFKVKSEDDLYRNVQRVDWSKFLDAKGSLAIDATVHSERFTHSKYIALKTKDAIVDKFRNEQGVRPDVDLDHPDLRINVHIQQDFCTLSLDSSGESLHRRGYRTETDIAPINEVLAAGLLLLSGWNGRTDFLDSMCGSGTILIEAAMIACNIPANLNREEFAFEKWNDWDVDLYENIENAALAKITDFPFEIKGYDASALVLAKAKENIANAQLTEFITLEQQDFFASEKHRERSLHMLFNPPYGERIPVEMETFYAKIGDTLKQGYPGTKAWFITSNLEALKHVGLRTSRKIKVFNGNLESRLVQYEIYEGSRKAKYQKE